MIRIIREPKNINDCTLGVMFVDGKFHSYCLENATLLIPSGEYKFRLYPSPKLKGRLVPLLEDVPGRDLIEIHVANEPHELLGCIAPGMTRTETGVWNSAMAFDLLMSKIRTMPVSEYKVRIEDPLV